MAVAWIGNRESTLEQAAVRAAELLEQSRCPVFSLDSDVHGWRAAIALAERVGGAYDQLESASLAREVALFTDKGAMTVAPGEVKRRADCVVIVGDLPAEHHAWVQSLYRTTPDLSGGRTRAFFQVPSGSAGKSGQIAGVKTTKLSGGAGAAQTLAAVRSLLLGRSAGAHIARFDMFAKALAAARYTVFLFSGASLDEMAAEMLQGLVADINRKQRAATMLLPSSDAGWGGVLASTWMTGFAPRTGFGRGIPEFDPWRFDVNRMIAAREADLHMLVARRVSAAGSLSPLVKAIALVPSVAPVARAAITISVGEAGVDHDAVQFSSRTGSMVSVAASKPSSLPAASSVIRMIADRLANEAPLQC